MSAGYTFILSQLSHGKCGGAEECLTHSPSGPRTLREEELTVHRGTLSMTRRTAVNRVNRRVEQQYIQDEECYAGKKADADIEPGLTTVHKG